MKLNVTPLLEAIEQYIAKADNDLEDQLNEEGYVEAGVAVSHMGAIEDGVTAAVENNVDEVLARLQSASGVDDFIENVWPEISNSDEMEKALYDLFYQQFDELLRRFTKQWIISADAELGEVVDDRITRPAEAFIKGWSQQLADIMHLNTKDGIEKILLDAQEQNQTIDEVAQAIADSGIRECGYRSRRVAVTEVLRVEEYAHQEARIQNPSCYKKEWVHTGAAHPRENHVAINGQQVFKREPFTLTGRNGGTYYPMQWIGQQAAWILSEIPLDRQWKNWSKAPLLIFLRALKMLRTVPTSLLGQQRMQGRVLTAYRNPLKALETA